LVPMTETMQGLIKADGLGNRGKVRVDEPSKRLRRNGTPTENNTLADRHQSSEGHSHLSGGDRQRVDAAHEARLLRRSDPAHLRRGDAGSHDSSRKSGGDRVLGVTPASSQAVPAEDASATQNQQGGRHQDWLTLHAADLIRKIQNWADALDSRKIQLDARVLRHEQRERRFRLHCQDFESDLNRQRNAIDQLQQEFASQSRQLDQG